MSYDTDVFRKEIYLTEREKMYFLELQQKLLDLARERVKTGVVTERGLARMCALSQPHMHNVLKNARTFSNDSYDRLMRALDIGVSDLMWCVSGQLAGDKDSRICAVPVLRYRIGPGTETPFRVFRGNVPMPGRLLKGLVDPVTAHLAPDLVLPGALAANDLVLLDQNPAVRAAPGNGGLWVVAAESGMRARYVRAKGGQLFIGNEVTKYDLEDWTVVSLHDRNILDVVRARIVWIGREMETEPARPVESSGESD